MKQTYLSDEGYFKFGFSIVKRNLLLMLSVLAFFIFGVALLVMGYQATSQFYEDAKLLNLATRQRALAVSIHQSLTTLETTLSAETPNIPEVERVLEGLKNDADLFNGTLLWMENGGRAVNLDRTLTDVQGLDRVEFKPLLVNTQALWQPYLAKLNLVVNSEVPELVDVQDAKQYSLSNHQPLLLLMDDITKKIEDATEARAAHIGQIQLILVLLIAVCFLVAMTQLVRKLLAADRRVGLLHQHAQQIAKINAGSMFELNADFKFSAAMGSHIEKLLGDKVNVGDSFIKLLKDRTNQKLAQDTQTYLSSLLVDGFNPVASSRNLLTAVDVQSAQGLATLSFWFGVSTNERGEPILLGYVRDISKQKLQADAMLASAQQSNQELGLAYSLFEHDKHALRALLSNLRIRFYRINEILRTSVQGAEKQASLQEILHEVDAMEAEAERRGVEFFAVAAANIKPVLQQLAGGLLLADNNMLMLLEQLSRFGRNIEKVDMLIRQSSQQSGQIQWRATHASN